MGSIRQFQRRAIERLWLHITKPRHPIESIYSLRSVLSDNLIISESDNLITKDARPLAILGISDGVGTCSDIHGMNVLVLSDHLLSQSNHKVTLPQIKDCTYAVLFHQASKEEAEREGFHRDAGIACVELLRVMDISFQYTNLQATGHRAYYVAVV